MTKRLKPTSYLFPLGFIIEVDNSDFNPNIFYSNGIWERIKGKVIVGVDENDNDFKSSGKTGGTKTHILTEAQMPSHIHKGLYWNNRDMSLNSVSGHTQYALSWSGNGASDSMAVNVGNTGGNQPHNNLQPYYTAYIWKLVSYS